jgi:uncharacterized tellurite resistance protein B-like protein
MTRRARDTFTGTLRASDPRRFLVEAMLAAMNSDGKIHEAEVISMQRHLEDHEIFSGLTDRHHEVLLGIARDALSFSNPLARIPAVAKGLPTRLHKLTGLAMACEVVIADTFIDQKEIIYLKTLRRALRIDRDDFEAMFQAAKDKRTARDLDERVTRLRELVPSIVELFALRSLALQNLTPAHRVQIGELIAAIPDLELGSKEELAALVERAYGRMHFSLDLETAIQKVAHALPSPVDRYWAIVYLMCADTSAAAHWRTNPFLMSVQRIFALDPADLDLAPSDAAGIVSILPGG